MAKKSSSNWVQLYFVLSSLLGLVLTAIGTMIAVNVLLTQTLFKTPSRYPYYNSPPEPYVRPVTLDNEQLTEEQKQSLEQWQKDYDAWQEESQNYDFDADNRRRDLVTALSLLITGIPILLFHAPWVFRQRG